MRDEHFVKDKVTFKKNAINCKIIATITVQHLYTVDS